MIFQRGGPLAATIDRTLLEVVLRRVCQTVEDIADGLPVLQVLRGHHGSTRHQVHRGGDEVEGIPHADHVGIGHIGPEHRVLDGLHLQRLVVTGSVVGLEEIVFLDGPSLALQQSAVLTHEHLLGILVTLQAPVEPGQGRDRELTTMGLTIGTTMTHGIVDGTGRHVVDTVEVVHTVLVGDILLATQQIHDRGVDLPQLLLRGHGHTTHGLTGVLLVEETAVADHQQFDTGVGAVEERLQATTRHTCHADAVHVDLLEEGRLGVSVLCEGPVDALDLLFGARHRTLVPLVVHRDESRGQHEVAVRGNLVEEVHVLPGGVRATTITPHQDGQQRATTELRQVLRCEHGVLGQSRHFGHHHLIGARTAVFNDSRLGSLLSTHEHPHST